MALEVTYEIILGPLARLMTVLVKLDSIRLDSIHSSHFTSFEYHHTHKTFRTSFAKTTTRSDRLLWVLVMTLRLWAIPKAAIH